MWYFMTTVMMFFVNKSGGGQEAAKRRGCDSREITCQLHLFHKISFTSSPYDVTTVNDFPDTEIDTV